MRANFLLVFAMTSVLFCSTAMADKVLPKDMNFKLRSGDLMPLVGFGTYAIVDEELIHNTLDHALAAGYRLIDTAKLYQNEEGIGKALKVLLPKHNLTRQDIFITTKLAFDDHGEPAYEALKESVRKLGTDYVDLYLIHWPGKVGKNATKSENPRLRDESWKQLTRGAKEGLARNIGVSNYVVRHLKELLANDHGIKPAVNQVQWHPHNHPQDLLDYCRKEGIFMQAYFSLGGTGDLVGLINDPRLLEIAKKLGKTPAQVLLRWALQENIGIIPKSRSEKHIKENIELDFEIPAEDMTTLNNFDPKKSPWDPDTYI